MFHYYIIHSAIAERIKIYFKSIKLRSVVRSKDARAYESLRGNTSEFQTISKAYWYVTIFSNFVKI